MNRFRQNTIELDSVPSDLVQESSHRHLFKRLPSPAVIATILFLSVNCILDKYCRHLVSIDSWSSVAISAIGQYRQLPKPPSIVLLGSSLMGRAMWQADSGHLLVPLDLPYEEYHGAQWFHAQLTKSGLNDPSIFDLATEGATTADMYLLCDKLLRTKRQPKLIIYGAAARDVSGCLFNCERNTPTFKLLFEPEDCHRLGHLFTTCWDEQLELEIYQLFPLHQNREAVKQLLLKNMAAITSSFVGHSLIVEPGFQNANAAADRKTDMNARFGSSATKDKRRLNNHLICLKLISQWAKERGIFLLIVNMPMLVGSFKETEIYKDYKKTIDECADDKQTFLLDLKDRPEFVNDCFYDGAHLNNKGSTKFIHYLTDWLNGHPYVLKNTQANLNIPHRFSNLSFASSN